MFPARIARPAIGLSPSPPSPWRKRGPSGWCRRFVRSIRRSERSAAHPRSRNFMQRSYIVWTRDPTTGQIYRSEGAYAPTSFIMSDTDFRELTFHALGWIMGRKEGRGLRSAALLMAYTAICSGTARVGCAPPVPGPGRRRSSTRRYRPWALPPRWWEPQVPWTPPPCASLRDRRAPACR
jgi:hypothetical protein